MSGMTKTEVNNEIADKIKVLKHMVVKNITSPDDIAMMVKDYYVDKEYLMRKIKG